MTDSTSKARTTSGLTHVRADGTAHMVDISAKEVTARRAAASGMVLLLSLIHISEPTRPH